MHATVLSKLVSADHQVAIFDRCEDVPAHCFEALVPSENVLHRPAYLDVLEQWGRSHGVGFYYCVVDWDGAPGIFCLFQTRSLKVGDIVRSNRFDKLWNAFPLRILMCGNMMVSGAPGIMCRDDVPANVAAELMIAAAKALQQHIAQRFDVLILKDVPPAVAAHTTTFRSAGYEPLQIEPAMTLRIKPNWHCFDDYLLDLRTRYRRKTKRIRRQSEGIDRRVLSVAEASRRLPELESLYNQVYDRAALQGPHIGASFFLTLRQRLKTSEFDLIGYFQGEDLLAFSSRFHVNNAVVAYFFGLDYRFNRKYSLFHNLLYDDIECAINVGAHELNFGRTTHEVKSSVGAIPDDLPSFFLPLRPMSRPLCWLVQALWRVPQWIACHPFRCTDLP